MSYHRRIDRLNPALIVLLVDQSESMGETIGRTSTTKAEAVADQLNTLIYELIIRCVKTPRQPPRPYFSLSVIGYSTSELGEPIIESALPGADSDAAASTTVLAANPLRITSRTGPAGGTVKSPVWLEPVGRGGTPMCGALRRATELAESWVQRYPDAFPPVIVNLSDGESTDGDPTRWADQLRNLSTADGHALLFNLSMSTEPDPVSLFPSNAKHLTSDYADRLFRMSSPLPEAMTVVARAHRIAVRPGARGFAFNADIKALASFLNVGTSVGQVA